MYIYLYIFVCGLMCVGAVVVVVHTRNRMRCIVGDVSGCLGLFFCCVCVAYVCLIT